MADLADLIAQELSKGTESAEDAVANIIAAALAEEQL